MPLVHRNDPFVCTINSQYAAVHFAANLLHRGYTKITNGHIERGTFTFRRNLEGWEFKWRERREDDREVMMRDEAVAEARRFGEETLARNIGLLPLEGDGA